jgi:hypothetical protein
VQLQYTFFNDTVAGSMVANVANNFQDFDASLQNGVTVSNNQLQLVSKNRQFMEIKEFSTDSSEHTLTFWFNAFSVFNVTICEFRSNMYGSDSNAFRIYLLGRMFIGRDLGFAVQANKWYHVAWVQSTESFYDDFSDCIWSLFLNGKIFGSERRLCVMDGTMSLNYLGQSHGHDIGYFDGSIREFRLYNSALNVNDIESIYAYTNPT